jgi:hypothetical protein
MALFDNAQAVQALGENHFKNAFVKLIGHHLIIKRFKI